MPIFSERVFGRYAIDLLNRHQGAVRSLLSLLLCLRFPVISILIDRCARILSPVCGLVPAHASLVERNLALGDHDFSRGFVDLYAAVVLNLLLVYTSYVHISVYVGWMSCSCPCLPVSWHSHLMASSQLSVLFGLVMVMVVLDIYDGRCVVHMHIAHVVLLSSAIASALPVLFLIWRDRLYVGVCGRRWLRLPQIVLVLLLCHTICNCLVGTVLCWYHLRLSRMHESGRPGITHCAEGIPGLSTRTIV